MKHIVLLSSTIIFNLFVFGQKLQKISIDKITGDTARITTTEKLFSRASFAGNVGEQLAVTVVKLKGNYYLAFTIQTAKTSFLSVDEGQKVYFKLNDQSVVTLVCAKDEFSEYNAVSNSTNARVYFPVGFTEIDRLLKFELSYIRIEYSGGNLDYEIKDKFQDVIKNLLKVIVEY